MGGSGTGEVAAARSRNGQSPASGRTPGDRDALRIGPALGAPGSFRAPRAAVVTSAALATIALAGLLDAWRRSTGRSAVGELVAAGVVIALVLALVLCMDRALFAPTPERSSLHLLGLGSTVAGLAALAWIGVATDVDVRVIRALAVGLCVARPLIGGVQSSQRPRRIWWQLGGAVVLWNVALAAYLVVGPDLPPWGLLVWETSDQADFYEMSVSLLRGRFERFDYQLGMPALVAPASLLTSHGVDDPTLPTGRGLLAGANLANTFLLPVFAIVVLPAFLWLVARAACHGIGVRARSVHVGVGMALTAVAVHAYLLRPPDYVAARNASLVPRRVLGLVFSMEPLGFVALAAGLVVLARRDRTWSPAVVGLLAGLTATLSERFIPTILLFVAVLFAVRAQRRLAIRAAAVGFLAFLPQLLYFRLVYGGWWFPNRAVQWGVLRPALWSQTATERFGLPEGTIPRRVSLDYVATNGTDMLDAHGAVIVLLAVSVAILLILHPRQWPLWLFCVGHIAVTGLLSAMYINIVVTWRYNTAALPAIALLVIAALAAVASRCWSWGTSRRARAGTRPGALASPL